MYSENDFSFSGKDTVKGTDAGTYDMELTAKDFANNNANFSNVEFYHQRRHTEDSTRKMSP